LSLPRLLLLVPSLSPLTDDGAKEDGRGDRQGRNANIHGREEVGHHEPIGVEVTQGQPVQYDSQPAG
jgi:hypothetical protein